MDYKQKLLDPRWQKKRLEILNRDNFICQNCGDETNTLHVHHRIYIYNKDIWDIPNEHLITLCAVCHEIETEEMKEYTSLLNEQLKLKFFADDLRELAHGINSLKMQHESRVIATVLKDLLSDDNKMRILIDTYLGRKRNG